ncbi:MAG: elongation factor P [Firmicutes bacterium]|nr:elongation factor P [Bacillota bacterium]
MIFAGDFRNGQTFEMDGAVFTVVSFQHVKPGKGAAFVRTKIRNVVTGAVLEKTFSPSDKFPKAHIEQKKMSYSYNDGGLYYFADQDWNLIPLNESMVEEALKYITENEEVQVKFYKGEPFSVEPPIFVELNIIECEPGARGDTAQGVLKPATVETGLVVQVPLFVNNGERIKIDTRSGEYVERVKG